MTGNGQDNISPKTRALINELFSDPVAISRGESGELRSRISELETEIERLKAQPTAEQERKWVLRHLSDRACHLKITDSYEGSRALERVERAIEEGEHWPKERE